jgi:ATP-dependent protease ClpP protease subunit
LENKNKIIVVDGPAPGNFDKDKFWEFKNLSESEAELNIYGEIASKRPWWDWEGETVTQKQFIDELKALGNKTKITLRINSPGGDVFAAHAIYSQLKTHSATIEGIVDGIAASAATIPLCACDTVKVYSNAMLMIHNPKVVLFDMYEASELNKLSDRLDKIKGSIIAAYKSKCSLEKKELSKLMDNEEWITAEEALEYGFVDEIMSDNQFEDMAISNDGRFLFVNNIKHDISRFSNKPNIFVPIKNNSQPPAVNNKQTQNKEGDKPMSFKTVDELKAACPDLVKQIEDAARVGERIRIKNIMDISKTIDSGLVNKAMFEEPMEAKDLAFEALKADSGKGTQYLKDTKEDIQNSGGKEVKGTNNDGKKPDEKPKTVQDKFKNFAAQFDAAARGVKK